MDKFKRKKLIVGFVALLTLPVSLPYFVIKTVRRKLRKARALQKIDAVDRLKMPEAPPDTGAGHGPLLSVVMPVYNIEPYLEASIASVLNQTYKHLELIIVNDASTDDSLAVAHMFERMDERVRVIDLPHNTMGGAGVPSNIGLEAAKGEYIAFLDGDDLLCPYSLDKMMERAIASGCDLTIGSFKNFFDDTKDIEKPYDVSTFGEIPSDVALKPADYPASLLLSAVPWRKIYKKAFLDTHKISFPEGDLFYEDNPLHWDVMTAAASMIVVPVTVVYHRMNRQGQTIGSAAPKLAAYFQHFTAISKRIRENGGDFAWEPLLKCVGRAHWIASTQSDPALADQFLLRFNQVIEEHIEPHLSKQHLPALKRLKYKFKTDKVATDLTAVIYHDDRKTNAKDLSLSIASAREVTGHSTDIIVLHTSATAPVLGPEAGTVLMVGTNTNATRSFNQALQLCSGRVLAFLHSGDAFVPGAVQSALSSLADETELSRYMPQMAQNAPAVGTFLYGRRFVQDNALFFGPTEDGHFSFDTLCNLYAKSTHELHSAPIERRMHRRDTMTAADLEKEADHLVRQLCAAPADAEEIHELLDSVSEFLIGSGKSKGSREGARLRLVDGQTSSDIAKAQLIARRKTAYGTEIKHLSGA